MSCGQSNISALLIRRLEMLGQALDQQVQLCVFNGGLVGFGDETESEVNAHVAQRQARRSATGSRQGQRTASRPRRRKAGQRNHLCTEAHERAFGSEFRVLAQHYDALGFEDEKGLWVAVSANPLGMDGPQAHFLVGVVGDRRIDPRAWAFSRIGPRAEPMSLKHTNFPDASVCAFTREDNAWNPADGLITLLDHYVIWAVKKWHRDIIGWWPGPQAGTCAIYRRREFLTEEWCGCGSGKRYGNCHQAADLVVDEAAGREEFRHLFACDYEDRQVPEIILKAARSRWKRMPTIEHAFAHRQVFIESTGN